MERSVPSTPTTTRGCSVITWVPGSTTTGHGLFRTTERATEPIKDPLDPVAPMTSRSDLLRLLDQLLRGRPCTTQALTASPGWDLRELCCQFIDVGLGRIAQRDRVTAERNAEERPKSVTVGSM